MRLLITFLTLILFTLGSWAQSTDSSTKNLLSDYFKIGNDNLPITSEYENTITNERDFLKVIFSHDTLKNTKPIKFSQADSATGSGNGGDPIAYEFSHHAREAF